VPADRVAELVAESERHRPGEALFVARVGERVVGVCGLNVDPYTAEPRVGRVRHLTCRGSGGSGWAGDWSRR
jgi:hypothetical protein